MIFVSLAVNLHGNLRSFTRAAMAGAMEKAMQADYEALQQSMPLYEALTLYRRGAARPTIEWLPYLPQHMPERVSGLERAIERLATETLDEATTATLSVL